MTNRLDGDSLESAQAIMVSPIVREINGADLIDMTSISEPEVNCLRITVVELRPQHNTDKVPPVEGATLMEQLDDSNEFEVAWNSYAAYTVVNESYTYGNGDDQYEGGNLRLYSSSAYTTYVRSTTLVDDLLPNYKHWAIVCAWHVIHIISNVNPEIRRIT